MAASLSSPSFNIRDNYGVNTVVYLEYERTAVTTWTAKLVDTTDGTRFTATSTIDTSGASPSPTSITFNWMPQSATGAQNTVSVVANIASITLVPASGNGDTTVATAATVSNGSAQVAFDPQDSATYNHTMQFTIYDSQGTSHQMDLYLRKTNQANEWEVFSLFDGMRVDASVGAGDQIIFQTNGQLLSPASPPAITLPTFNAGGGASAINMSIDIGGVIQYGSPLSIFSITQNGYPTGQVAAKTVSDTGLWTNFFTNNQSKLMGRIALARFGNPAGLQPLANGLYQETALSGAPIISAPGEVGFGLILVE